MPRNFSSGTKPLDVWQQMGLEAAGPGSLLCEMLGLSLISSILWWFFCAGACWEGPAPFLSCLSAVCRCLVFFKAWCNTPSLFTAAQSGNRDCFVLFFFFLPFQCTKDFHSFFHWWRAKKGISTPKSNVFLMFPFQECCIRVIWIALWCWGDRLGGQAKNKKRKHWIESLILRTTELPLKCYNQWDDSCISHQMFHEWNADIFRSFSS